MGIVYLTGAGPGDIELLTLKAYQVVQEADVIVYDRLANPDILKEAKESCELIFVGKADSHHILAQDAINELLYQLALKYDKVVRLKGGDPLVFGRGGEEALYLKSKGIKFEFIPGITSAIAVPEYAGIPVTHRGVTTSFCVVTGHESPDKKESQIPWDNFKSNDTIIFLMGLNNLKKISKKLIEIGKAKDVPVAVISRGTTKEVKSVTGTLENIYEKAKDLPTPALIIVGEVVRLQKDLAWYKECYPQQ
ncbi:MAG TPA: uroporphyrinogen-III C-methyltransferase [Nitratifractor sp.]|nr:uroporphyrinogen-III C-methyltransferase [Nitratifractor sp.]